MSQLIGLQKITDFSGGMVTESSDSLTPSNVMRLIQNFDDDVLGILRVRKGVTAIGSQIQDGKNCLGLFNFRDSGSGSNNQIIAGFNNSSDSNSILYYGTTWTAITAGGSFTANAIFRFETFIDYVFIVNSAGDTPKSWNGNTGTAIGSDNLASAPAGKFIASFNSRLYIAGTNANPDRLYFSGIQSGGAITWDTTNDWIDINPADGMNITGLAKTGTLLLIFKERAMYRWNGRSTDANLVVETGTTSQESIAEKDGRIYFFNPQGVYVTNGGYPLLLTKGIQRWIDAIDPAFYTKVSAVTNENHYYLSIGDVTVDDIAYSNVVLVFTFSSQTWRVRTYAEQIMRFAPYIGSDGSYKIMCGNDDGDVQDFNVGNTDDGTPITYRVKTKRMDFGSFAYIKKFSDIFIFDDKLPGAMTFIQSDNKPAKQIKWTVSGWFKRLLGIKNSARYFILELSGNSQGGQGEFLGWEITDLAFDGYLEE